MYKWLFILVLPIFLMGCEVFDKPEQIPSYIYIDNFTLTTDSGLEGENTHAITDAWVYVNDDLVGIFELPARVPILAEGVQNIEIKPGIQRDGISEVRVAYPFYESFTLSPNLVRDSVIQVSPSTSYKAGLNFIVEDFEGAGQILIRDADSDTSWVIESVDGPTGQFGRLILDGTKTNAYMRTDNNHNFPKLGVTIYLEVDVRTNNRALVGVLDESGGNTVKQWNNYGINRPSEGESPSWKKIYIDLTATVSTESQATQHEFFIDVLKDTDISTAQLDFDNIKIVHF